MWKTTLSLLPKNMRSILGLAAAKINLCVLISWPSAKKEQSEYKPVSNMLPSLSEGDIPLKLILSWSAASWDSKIIYYEAK